MNHTHAENLDFSRGAENRHNKLMFNLMREHDSILELIGRRHVHYLDLPVYGNIGDLLIMLGTLEFFRKNNIQCAIKAGFFNYNPTEASSSDILIFQGGGNLGDLYVGPQQLREACATTAKQSRIVILPQTIHFKSIDSFEKCATAFRSHPDLHIFARDLKSLELAQELTKNSYLAPDMAHQLWHHSEFQPRATKRAFERLGLIRTDGESISPEISSCTKITDWPDLVGPVRENVIRNAYRAVRLIHHAGINKPFRGAQMHLWIWYAKKLAREAASLLSSASHLTTDRLHGHILACLLGVPHTLIDNEYGKNSGYANAWTIDSELVTLDRAKTP